ncbi:POTRA domain-containing protein [Aestuariivivens insulae]|uniref:POTRA domain-containing protein n=1 Tax=Aestuariivivens insulae TaxID=1621988 RepID=UPI001F587CC6|nr:POTRA domain-containing protein [Aestuariivivens insulae]
MPFSIPIQKLINVKKSTFLLLIIYILFSSEIDGQNLNLKIEGTTQKETTLIDSLGYNKTLPDYQSIVNIIDTLQNKIYKLGYIENKLESIIKNNDSTFIAKMQLNQKFNSIYIYYDKTLIDPEIINAISKHNHKGYFLLHFSEVENALLYINSKIAEAGYPFTKIKLSNISIDGDNLKTNLIIKTNKQKRSVDNIIIKGYEKFPISYLKHYLKIKTGQTFDLATIKNKTERLSDLKFANQIKSPEVLFSKDSTTLYLYIEKAKSNNFDGFIGFGSNEDTGNIEFDGYLNLNLSNNLNYGETFRLLYKSDENDQKTFEANLSLPYLLKSPIGLDLQLYLFKRDSSFTNANQTIKLNYQINSKTKIYTGISALESNNLSTNSTSQITDFDANFISMGFQYATLQNNDLLFPINTTLNTEFNFGKRKTTTSSENQTKFALDAFKIINLSARNSLYLRISGASITSDTYFENELIRFGGINSIRGFEENSLYASLFGLLNTEYRYRLNNTIYAHSIIDAAYFENKITASKEKLFGFGFGFGLLTKSGLFRFIYANGKNENQKFKLSNSKIHLSLTAPF